jgi:hypothetical protein
MVLSVKDILKDLSGEGETKLSPEMVDGKGLQKLLEGQNSYDIKNDIHDGVGPDILKGLKINEGDNIGNSLRGQGVEKYFIREGGRQLDFVLTPRNGRRLGPVTQTHVLSFETSGEGEDKAIKETHSIVSDGNDGSRVIEKIERYFDYNTGGNVDMQHGGEYKYEGHGYTRFTGLNKNGGSDGGVFGNHPDPYTAAINVRHNPYAS